jgi:hypothetical protein
MTAARIPLYQGRMGMIDYNIVHYSKTGLYFDNGFCFHPQMKSSGNINLILPVKKNELLSLDHKTQ